jgi:hypothetical protein
MKAMLSEIHYQNGDLLAKIEALLRERASHRILADMHVHQHARQVPSKNVDFRLDRVCVSEMHAIKPAR